MRSRTVRPVRRQEQENQNRKKSRNRPGDTQPLRGAGYQGRNSSLSDTRPMRPVSIRSGYAGYQKVIDQRRQVIRTPKPLPDSRPARPAKAKRQSGVAGLIARSRKRAANEQYFDLTFCLSLFFLCALD